MTSTNAVFSGGTYTYDYIIPSIPDACAGKTLTKTEAALYKDSLAAVISEYYSGTISGLTLNQCLNYATWDYYPLGTTNFKVTKENKAKYFATCDAFKVHPAEIYSMTNACGTSGSACYCGGTCVGTENNCGPLPDNTYCTSCDVSPSCYISCSDMAENFIFYRDDYHFTSEESFDAKPLNHLEQFAFNDCACSGDIAECATQGCIITENRCRTADSCKCDCSNCHEHCNDVYSCSATSSICSTGCLAQGIYGVKLYNQSSYSYNLYKCNSTFEDGICPDHFSNPDGTGLNICSSHNISDYDCMPRVQMKCGNVTMAADYPYTNLPPSSCNVINNVAKNCPNSDDCVYADETTGLNGVCYPKNSIITNKDGRNITCTATNNYWCPNRFDYLSSDSVCVRQFADPCDEGVINRQNNCTNPMSNSTKCLSKDPQTQKYNKYCGVIQEWGTAPNIYQLFDWKGITVK